MLFFNHVSNRHEVSYKERRYRMEKYKEKKKRLSMMRGVESRAKKKSLNEFHLVDCVVETVVAEPITIDGHEEKEDDDDDDVRDETPPEPKWRANDSVIVEDSKNM